MEENSTINEDMVRYFVWAIGNFFTKTSDAEPEIEPPYLLDRFDHNDYTGTIGVSGNQHGAVYFTVGRELLLDLFENHYGESLGETAHDIGADEFEELLADSAGEMTNVVAGNVRNYLGENFLISTPVVSRCASTPLAIASGLLGIVFPIRWKEHACHVVVGLKPNAN